VSYPQWSFESARRLSWKSAICRKIAETRKSPGVDLGLFDTTLTVTDDLADATETIALVEGAGSETLGVQCDLFSAEDVADL